MTDKKPKDEPPKETLVSYIGFSRPGRCKAQTVKDNATSKNIGCVAKLEDFKIAVSV